MRGVKRRLALTSSQKRIALLYKGLYYVETDQYFPMRGNGWYSHAMINYCIDKCVINVSDIKYVIYSGLSITKEYFNFF